MSRPDRLPTAMERPTGPTAEVNKVPVGYMGRYAPTPLR